MKKDFLLVDKKKRLRFTRELTEEFYEEQKGLPFFRDLIDYMTSGDCMALCLAKDNGITHWKNMMGPYSERARPERQPLRVTLQWHLYLFPARRR